MLQTSLLDNHFMVLRPFVFTSQMSFKQMFEELQVSNFSIYLQAHSDNKEHRLKLYMLPQAATSEKARQKGRLNSLLLATVFCN